ncbi:hypothetical protein [Thiocapsa sp.]|uniref:hypothetical protein n=1 Tax=Thiocapsa sp. TaxID=2024551 RepID=UPI001BCBAE3A
MDQHPGLGALVRIDLGELVGVAPARLGIAHHLLQLLVEKFMAFRPVDRGMDPRKEERKKVREVTLEGFLPGAVVVVARGVGHRMGRPVVRSERTGEYRDARRSWTPLRCSRGDMIGCTTNLPSRFRAMVTTPWCTALSAEGPRSGPYSGQGPVRCADHGRLDTLVGKPIPQSVGLVAVL